MTAPKTDFGRAYLLATRFLRMGNPCEPNFYRKNRLVRYQFAVIAAESVAMWQPGRALYVWINAKHVEAGVECLKIWLETCEYYGLNLVFPARVYQIICEKFVLLVARADPSSVVISEELEGDDRDNLYISSLVKKATK